MEGAQAGPLHAIGEVQRKAIKLQEVIAKESARGDENEELDDGESSEGAGAHRKRVWFGDWYAGRIVGAGISGESSAGYINIGVAEVTCR